MADVYIDDIWEYYLLLENDFMKTERYVAFDKSNKCCFSNEYLKQYLSICSEIDSVCKSLCETIDEKYYKNEKNKPKKINMKLYSEIILPKMCLENEEVELKSNNSYKLKPWKYWQYAHVDLDTGKKIKYNSPYWWKDYNSIKHNRFEESNKVPIYKKATLHNILQSLSALYILEMRSYEYVSNKFNGRYNMPFKKSKLFKYNTFNPNFYSFEECIFDKATKQMIHTDII